MDIVLLKLLLTPLFVAGLTLIGRRWGPAATGAVAGLPLTSGPVSIFLALEQGKDFAAHAAITTLAGLIAVGAFCLAYALIAARKNWLVSAIAGMIAFFISAALLLFVRIGLMATFIAVAFVLGLILRQFPKTSCASEHRRSATPQMGFCAAHRDCDGIGSPTDCNRAPSRPTSNWNCVTVSSFRRSACDLCTPARRRSRCPARSTRRARRLFLLRRLLPARWRDAAVLQHRRYIHVRCDCFSRAQCCSV